MRTITNSVQTSRENIFISPSPQYKTESPNQYLSRNILPYSSPAQTVITSSNTQQNNSKRIPFHSSTKNQIQSSSTSMTDSGEKDGLRHFSAKSKPLTNKKFTKMALPSNNSQIEVFVKNLLDYLSVFQSDNYASLFLKTKLLTRYEDYVSNGLQQNYFIMSLYRMQKELISMICKENESLVINT